MDKKNTISFEKKTLPQNIKAFRTTLIHFLPLVDFLTTAFPFFSFSWGEGRQILNWHPRYVPCFFRVSLWPPSQIKNEAFKTTPELAYLSYLSFRSTYVSKTHFPKM